MAVCVSQTWLPLQACQGTFSFFFFFPMMPMFVTRGCRSVNCLYVMFPFLFFDRNKRSDPLRIDNSFTAAVTHCTPAIFLTLSVIHNDNQTDFRYTLPRIIISHQNLLSNALLRILHRNEISLLCMNLPPPPTPDFARLPLDAGHTGSYYWHPQ